MVGGGVVGTASALRLREAGFAVTVLDPRERVPPASWGNAGHIAVEQVEPLASRATLRAAPRALLSSTGALSIPLTDMRVWAPFAWRVWRASRPEVFEAGRIAMGGLLRQAMPAWIRFASTLRAPGLLRQDGHLIVWRDAARAAAGRAAWARTDWVGVSRAPADSRAADRSPIWRISPGTRGSPCVIAA